MITKYKIKDYPEAHVECDDLNLPFYNFNEWFQNKSSIPFIYGEKDDGNDFVLLGNWGGTHSEIFSDFRKELRDSGLPTRYKALCARIFAYNSLDEDAPSGFLTAWVSEEPDGYSSSERLKRITELLAKNNFDISNVSIMVEYYSGNILEDIGESRDGIYEVRVSDYITLGLSSFKEIPDAYERQERRRNSGGSKSKWHELPYRLYRWQSDEEKEANPENLLTESYFNSIIKLEADKQNPEGGFICGCDISIPQWGVKMNNEDKRTNPVIYMVGDSGKEYVYVGGPGEDHNDVFKRHYEEILSLGLKAYGNMVKARIYNLSGCAKDADIPPGLLVFWSSIVGNSSKEVKGVVDGLKRQGVDIEDYYIGVELMTKTESFYTRQSALYFMEVLDYISSNFDSVDEIKDEYERRERKARQSSSSSGKASWHDLPYRLERWQSDESVEKDLKKLIKECVWKALRELCTK